MILSLGWSSWELKIDPKKVKEENEHVLEEDMSQTKCQESSKRMTHAKKVRTSPVGTPKPSIFDECLEREGVLESSRRTYDPSPNPSPYMLRRHPQRTVRTRGSALSVIRGLHLRTLPEHLPIYPY